MALVDVKALIFDVFGTVVDWRSSIIKQCQDLGQVRGIEADWDAFADAWRSQYRAIPLAIPLMPPAAREPVTN